MANKKSLTTRAQKVLWLLQNADKWHDLPPTKASLWSDEQRTKLTELRVAATDAGLYSPQSYRLDTEASLLKLIHVARSIRRRGSSDS